MTGTAELHAQALDATGRILRGVPADRWHAATPGAGWDARALVNHLVSGNLWAAELAAGGTIEGAGSRLGGDPAAALDPAADEGLPTDRRAATGSVPLRGHVRPRGGGPGGREHTNPLSRVAGQDRLSRLYSAVPR